MGNETVIAGRVSTLGFGETAKMHVRREMLIHKQAYHPFYTGDVKSLSNTMILFSLSLYQQYRTVKCQERLWQYKT